MAPMIRRGKNQNRKCVVDKGKSCKDCEIRESEMKLIFVMDFRIDFEKFGIQKDQK